MFAQCAPHNGPCHDAALPLFAHAAPHAASSNDTDKDPQFIESVAESARFMLQSDILFGAGWPQFWVMTFTSGLSEGLCMLILPDIAFAQLNNGHDPCLEGSKYHSQAACDNTVTAFMNAGSIAFFSGTILSFWAA